MNNSPTPPLPPLRGRESSPSGAFSLDYHQIKKLKMEVDLDDDEAAPPAFETSSFEPAPTAATGLCGISIQ